jgi:hypothetical protein
MTERNRGKAEYAALGDAMRLALIRPADLDCVDHRAETTSNASTCHDGNDLRSVRTKGVRRMKNGNDRRHETDRMAAAGTAAEACEGCRQRCPYRIFCGFPVAK